MASWYKPDSKMTEEELQEAYKAKIRFPEVVKVKKDPPLKVKCKKCGNEAEQSFAGISIMMLPEPKDGIYAFAKVRGGWEDKESLTEYAKMVVKEVDSKFATNGVPMGNWFPITDDSKYVSQEILVRQDLTTGKITDDPIKAAEDRHNAIIKQLREREKILRDSTAPDDPTSNKEGLEYYTMSRVTIEKIADYIAEGEEKLNELRKTRQNRIEELKDLEEKYPQYKDQWLETYNKKRREVGLNDYVPGDSPY